MTIEILKKEKDSDEVEIIQCDKCKFMARSVAGLKVHNRAKHKEQTRIKCWKCDYTSTQCQIFVFS